MRDGLVVFCSEGENRVQPLKNIYLFCLRRCATIGSSFFKKKKVGYSFLRRQVQPIRWKRKKGLHHFRLHGGRRDLLEVSPASYKTSLQTENRPSGVRTFLLLWWFIIITIAREMWHVLFESVYCDTPQPLSRRLKFNPLGGGGLAFARADARQGAKAAGAFSLGLAQVP